MSYAILWDVSDIFTVLGILAGWTRDWTFQGNDLLSDLIYFHIKNLLEYMWKMLPQDKFVGSKDFGMETTIL